MRLRKPDDGFAAMFHLREAQRALNLVSDPSREPGKTAATPTAWGPGQLDRRSSPRGAFEMAPAGHPIWIRCTNPKDGTDYIRSYTFQVLR